jgi:uncharacterized protein YwgA
MPNRNYVEALTDRLLMLFLISECQKIGCRITGKVKLTKLLYLAENKMIKNQIKGLNYDFFRWDYGPMSAVLLQDLDCLSENGLLEKSENFIGITNRGLSVLKSSTALLDRNKELLEYIRKIVREFGPYKGKSLKEIVYGSPKINEKKQIARTEHGEELLNALPLEQAKQRFWIDDEWTETLVILLDKGMCESLERGIQDAKEGKIQKYTPFKTAT